MKVTLSEIEHHHLRYMKDWRNDPELLSRNRQWRWLTMEDQEEWYRGLHKCKWPEHLMFLIRVAKTPAWNRPVGACGLTNIDWIARSAEVSIYVGEPEFRCQGVGSEALRLLEEWAFERMNLVMLWAEVYSHAGHVIGFLKKNGYGQCGSRVNSVYKEGMMRDSLYYAKWE